MPSFDQQEGCVGDTSAGQIPVRVEPVNSLKAAKADPMPAILQKDKINLHDAEKFAQSLLSRTCITAQQLADLCKLLPAEQMARESADSKGSVWVSGAYQKGGLVGLRANLEKFPYSTMCFTKFASSQVPSLSFSSLAVLRQHHSTLRIDANNSCEYPNWVCPLTALVG